MPSDRKYVGVATRFVEVVAPRVACRMPPALLVPEIQRSVPLVDAALRGLPPLMASVRAVVVSIAPVPAG